MFAPDPGPSSGTQSSKVADRSGTAPPSPRGESTKTPLYVLRGPENRKTQLERLTAALCLVFIHAYSLGIKLSSPLIL
jgi:hypothetical protein